MSSPVLGAIWAQSLNAVIGRDGGMPWYAPEDLAHFKAVTVGAPVIMGRKTWDSFPEKFRPLPGRENIVVTRGVQAPIAKDGALWVPSLDAALELASGMAETLWLIGGSQLYRQALERNDLPAVAGGKVSTIERTIFAHVVSGDAIAPDLDPTWSLVKAGGYQRSTKGWIKPEAEHAPIPLDFRFESWQRPM